MKLREGKAVITAVPNLKGGWSFYAQMTDHPFEDVIVKGEGFEPTEYLEETPRLKEVQEATWTHIRAGFPEGGHKGLLVEGTLEADPGCVNIRGINGKSTNFPPHVNTRFVPKK